jgi:GntR family transcriptional regulator/MocR family aminotransferase
VQPREPAQSNSWRLVSLGLDCYPQRYCPSISDTCRQENGDGNREPVKKHGRARQRHKPTLLAWARETGAWIIEDDYASEFRYSGRPLASLQGLDDCDRVIYFGTLNKTLFPGLRIGYAVVPPQLLKAFTSARCLMDRQPPALQQSVLAEFMQEGYFAAHIRRLRLAYRDQRDLLVAELSRRVHADLTTEAPDQGMYLVANLRQGLRDTAVQEAARRNGLVVRAMSRLYKKAAPRSALMLGFSGYLPQLVVPAAARLARVLRVQRRTGAQ